MSKSKKVKKCDNAERAQKSTPVNKKVQNDLRSMLRRIILCPLERKSL